VKAVGTGRRLLPLPAPAGPASAFRHVLAAESDRSDRPARWPHPMRPGWRDPDGRRERAGQPEEGVIKSRLRSCFNASLAIPEAGPLRCDGASRTTGAMAREVGKNSARPRAPKGRAAQAPVRRPRSQQPGAGCSAPRPAKGVKRNCDHRVWRLSDSEAQRSASSRLKRPPPAAAHPQAGQIEAAGRSAGHRLGDAQARRASGQAEAGG